MNDKDIQRELDAGAELTGVVLSELPAGPVSMERMSMFLGGVLGSVSARNGFEWTHRLLEQLQRTLREGERQVRAGATKTKH
ncbi:hypothetical protein ACFPPA_05730 [Rhodanobacter ginsengisoli]|uniref:Uncharacterized protein n=1 Tax=Rhodanobacter ginsengisoli TaxID=418646 RepID=A0ABW0QJV7_9GAMM